MNEDLLHDTIKPVVLIVVLEIYQKYTLQIQIEKEK